MTKTGLWTLAAAGLALLATPASAADPQELAAFDPKAKITKYLNATCTIDDGKVDAKVLNGQPIKAKNSGCLTIVGKDGVPYFVSKSVARIVCLAQNSAAAPIAGSAAATESCKRPAQ